MIKRKLASERPCKNCGEMFKPRVYLVNQGRGIFCSIQCSNQERSGVLKISKERLMRIYKAEGSIHKTAKALGIGWKITYNTMKRLGIDTSGRLRLPSTYESCYNPEGKRVAMHTVIAEKKYGRKLEKGEVVHHIDGNRQNNNEENLCILTREKHNQVHQQLQKIGYILYKKFKINFNEVDGYTISVRMEEVLDGK